MALATINKQFTFHASHRLPNHDGLCRNLHGHTYRMEVFVTGVIRPVSGDSDEGMVLDFGELKDIYAEMIEPLVEHRHLNESLKGVLPEGDDNALTTSENLASWMRDVFVGVYQEAGVYGNALPIRSIAVRLWETPTSYAEAGTTPWRSE